MIAIFIIKGYYVVKTSNLFISRFNVKKEINNKKGNSGSLEIETLLKVIEGIELIKVTLKSIKRRIYNFEVKFKAVVIAIARPKHLETYIGRANNIELPSIYSEEVGDNGGITAPRYMPRS